MINTITKRDGTVVEFDVNKINRWGDWASETCGVAWSDVIFDAIKTVHEGVTSVELHNALIRACLERRTEGHARMASRLLIGAIYKEAHDDFSIPAFLDFYSEVVDLGLWRDMDYSEEELSEIDKFIDPTRDFTYAYATVKQFYDKYAAKYYGVVKESPQMAFMGIAMSVCEGKDKSTRLDEVKKYYDKLSLLKLNLPTPTLSRERTPHNSSPSCCLISGSDSVDSIGAATHVAYKMTAIGAGIGVELRTRAPKDPVGHGRVSHGGKYGYYSYVDRAVKSNRQDVRGGSATITYNALDPEIMELLTMKMPRTDPEYRLEQLDYSFAANELFFEKVAKNEDWMLVSPLFAPELWEASYCGDKEKFKQVYEKTLQSSVKKTFIKARDVLKQWVKARGDLGRNYIKFIDNVNAHTPFKDSIKQSNLCVAPETLLLTDNGYVEIHTLKDKEVTVWNGLEWTNSVVHQTGEDQELVSIITDSGHELDCTEYHRFSVFDGYSRPFKVVQACDLKVGDKLERFNLPVIEGDKTLEYAYDNGFFTGDGTTLPNGKARVYLYHDKRLLVEHFSTIEKLYSQENQLRDYWETTKLKDKFFVPNNTYTIKSRLKWLEGFADADGCIYRNKSNEQLVLSSTEKPFLREIQLMLQTLGVNSKLKKYSEGGLKQLPLNNGTGNNGLFLCKDGYRLLIPSNDLLSLQKLGFSPKRLKITMQAPQRNATRFISILEIKHNGRISDTYCLTEPNRNKVMFNGMLTMNCQEVMLPTEGFEDISALYSVTTKTGEVALCNLGSIVVSAIEDDADYEESCYVLCDIIDTTIESGNYPFPHIEKTAKARRSIGVGMTDLAHLIALNGLKYDTEEGRNFIHEQAERHSYFLHKASVRLAKEKGACEWMYKTKYADDKPWLPIDTYSKQVDQYHTTSLKYPWESIREGIKQYGVRFSVLEAYMPTESSSLLTNSCNSIYPIRKKEIYKSSPKGAVYFRAPNMDFLSYQNAYSINELDMVKVYALVQKFTGQGISADFYTKLRNEDEKLSVRNMTQRVLLASKLGMKTFYYENFLTTEGEIEQEGINCDSCHL